MKIRLKISQPGQRAFTLIEMLVAFGVGVTVVGVIVALGIVTAQNYKAITNYVNMDDQSRNALDLISREIREASALVSFNTNNPQTLVFANHTDGTSVTLTYSSSAQTLTLAKTGQATKTLLTGCAKFNFQMFNRHPMTNTYAFYYATNFTTGQLDARVCKVINMNWKCSRAMGLGSTLNTEIVQTAQVVLRNKVQ